VFGIAGKIGNNPMFFFILKQGLLGGLHLFTFHLYPLVEPLYRILDGLEFELEILVDIRAGKGVGDFGGQYRVLGLKAEV